MVPPRFWSVWCVYISSLPLPKKLKTGILGFCDDCAFGDLRQFLSFGLVQPNMSVLQRLRPLRTTTAPTYHPPEPGPWPILITGLRPFSSPSVILTHRPRRRHLQMRYAFSRPTLLLFNRLVNPNYVAKPRVTLSPVCSDFFTSCSSDASTTSSYETEIHISGALKDVEPPGCSGILLLLWVSRSSSGSYPRVVSSVLGRTPKVAP